VELTEADGVLRVLLVIKKYAPEWAGNGSGNDWPTWRVIAAA